MRVQGGAEGRGEKYTVHGDGVHAGAGGGSRWRPGFPWFSSNSVYDAAVPESRSWGSSGGGPGDTAGSELEVGCTEQVGNGLSSEVVAGRRQPVGTRLPGV